MTAEDVSEYCNVVMLPLFLSAAQELINAHDSSITAHPYIQGIISDLDSRLALMELMYNTDVSGNPFTVTFATLTGVVVEWAMGGMKADEKLLAENMKELVDNIERLSYYIYQYKNEMATETEILSTLPIRPEILPKKDE